MVAYWQSVNMAIRLTASGGWALADRAEDRALPLVDTRPSWPTLTTSAPLNVTTADELLRVSDAWACVRVLADSNRLLEAMFEAGDLAPVGVPFPTLPKYAGPNQRAIAAHMQLRMGLRLAVGNEKPLIYAASEAVLYGHAPNKSAAWHAIKGLEQMGVIEHVDTLRGRGGRRGTKCYGPAPLTAPNATVSREE
jgi:hypothetical protein